MSENFSKSLKKWIFFKDSIKKTPNWEDRQRSEQIFERLISNIGMDPARVFKGFYYADKKDFGFVGKKSDSLESKKVVVGDFISKVFSDTDVYLDVKYNKATIFKTIERSFYELGFRQTRSTHGNVVIRFI